MPVGTVLLISGALGVSVLPRLLRGRVLKARTQPAGECHIVAEVADNASVDRLYNMAFGGRELFMDVAEEGEIEQIERRSGSPSPVRCPDEELLRGQMLADCRWSDVAIEIVWGTSRHAGTKESVGPYHWMILQSARQSMVPSNGSLFDLSPGDSSEYFDNHFSHCGQCNKRWWLVDTPVLGICPVCEVEVIKLGLDVKATLEASRHSPFVLLPDGDEDLGPPMKVDASGAEVPDFGDTSGVAGVDLSEDPEVQGLLPTPVAEIWSGSTIMINPGFCPKRNREWIDLVALDFLRIHQRRPGDPNVIYRIDEAGSNRDG